MTLSIAGAKELGPREEKYATFVETGFPTYVLEGLILASGFLNHFIYTTLQCIGMMNCMILLTGKKK
jgi:hypothetical protein